MNPDDQFLARAIELARIGSESGEGGPFGAVIVRDGKIIEVAEYCRHDVEITRNLFKRMTFA